MFGHVVIVTNAENGWVELTTQKFFSHLTDIVETLDVVSARSTYEPEGVTNPSIWKRLAFTNIITKFYEEHGLTGRLNVISLGDSSHEREAVLHVTKELPIDIVTKSLKLMERPDVYHMHKQHDILRSCMKEIVGHDQMLDLCIQVQAPDDPSDTLPEVLQKGSQIAADMPTQSAQAAQAFETKTVPTTPPAAVVRVDFFLSIVR